MNAPFNQTTLCPLGPSVASPVASLVKYFKDEITQRLEANVRAAAEVPA
jgi:NADH:ubiquinone oxidoreductase subunit F (NADH-binding)